MNHAPGRVSNRFEPHRGRKSLSFTSENRVRDMQILDFGATGKVYTGR